MQQFCTKIDSCEQVERLRERKWDTDAEFNHAVFQLCVKCNDYRAPENFVYELNVSFKAKVKARAKLDETDLAETIKEILQEWAPRLDVTLSNIEVEVA